ncbi:hypothetical protein GCM10025780_35010 [Frondihabitans cladoniiphilus]|uniref:Alpha-L-rhamnosidase n=2 Tax=Frondihabitans cladoniiphilus TaxID=715785 RepID=A0ABP8WBQ2_9MICO
MGASAGWRKDVVAPTSRHVIPAAVLTSTSGVTDAQALVDGGTTVLTRAPNAAVPTVTLDFGKVVSGYPEITFAGASSDRPGLRLAFSETKEYLTDGSDFSRKATGEAVDPGTDQIAVPSGASTWKDADGCASAGKVCASGLHAFRYLRIGLDALASDAPLTRASGSISITSVALDFTPYLGTPASYKGSFESSDAQLNAYWYDASYTNELITDTFHATDTDPRGAATPGLEGKLVLTDGAKRDRDPYVGDISVSGRTDYLTHDVGEAAENVLADVADHQRADGYIPPASILGYGLPLFDYPMYWVTSSWDYEAYTGDVAYARKYWGALTRVLDDWYPSVTDANGLLSRGMNGTSTYGDYAFVSRTGEVTYYNALYVEALHDASRTATALGHPTESAAWSERAEAVRKAINVHLWDAGAGAYLDSATGTAHAQDGIGTAIVAGVASEARASSSLAHLSATTANPWGNAFYDDDSTVSDGTKRVYAFTSYPEIEARFLTGHADSAIDEIKRLYGSMLASDPGTTFWEGVGDGGVPYEKGYTSMAHGWSTGVLPALTNDLLGAAPTGVGFSTWTIAPHPGSVSWARGTLPTPHGDLALTWKRANSGGGFSLSVTSPQGTTGVVSIPVSGAHPVVTLDGLTVYDGSKGVSHNASRSGDRVSIPSIAAGSHTVTVAG